MKTNHQRETDAALAAIPAGERPRLLLHSCCGPCSSYVIEYLSRYFRLGLLFYGPNIQPESEYEKRLAHQKKLLKAMPCAREVELIPCAWRGEDFTAATAGLEAEPEGGARCTACFLLRIEETARQAKILGYDYFCTTLTVSPHKDAERINAIGRALEARCGVKWLPSDFKKREGYKRSVQLAEQYGLYRQDYCGCLFSRRREESAGFLPEAGVE